MVTVAIVELMGNVNEQGSRG